MKRNDHDIEEALIPTQRGQRQRFQKRHGHGARRHHQSSSVKVKGQAVATAFINRGARFAREKKKA